MERDRDGREFLRQLETMLEDISGLPASAPQSPDELLGFLEISLSSQQHRYPILAKLKQLTWNIAAWLWDGRITRQIKLIREIGCTVGWGSPCILDAIRDLDDLVFARTYGRKTQPRIKEAVRRIARQNLMATYQLRNLLQNDRLSFDHHSNRVIAKDRKWLVPMAALLFIVATVAFSPFVGLLLYAPTPIPQKIVGLSVYSALYFSYCSVIHRFLVMPHKLTPQIQELLPKIALVG